MHVWSPVPVKCQVKVDKLGFFSHIIIKSNKISDTTPLHCIYVRVLKVSSIMKHLIMPSLLSLHKLFIIVSWDLNEIDILHPCSCCLWSNRLLSSISEMTSYEIYFDIQLDSYLYLRCGFHSSKFQTDVCVKACAL